MLGEMPTFGFIETCPSYKSRPNFKAKNWNTNLNLCALINGTCSTRVRSTLHNNGDKTTTF